MWKELSVLGAIIGVVFSCGSPTIPSRDPLIDGVIIEIAYYEAQAVAIDVKEDPADQRECGYTFGALSEAEILSRTVGGFFVPMEPEELSTGDRVKVWNRHAILDRCPALAIAAVVVVKK